MHLRVIRRTQPHAPTRVYAFAELRRNLESDECNERSPRSRQRGRSPELFSPFLPPSLFNSAVVLERQRGVPSRTCTACFRVNKIYSLRLSGKPRRRAICTAATAVPQWRGDLYHNSFKEIKRSSSFGELDSPRIPSSLVEFILSQNRRVIVGVGFITVFKIGHVAWR